MNISFANKFDLAANPTITAGNINYVLRMSGMNRDSEEKVAVDYALPPGPATNKGVYARLLTEGRLDAEKVTDEEDEPEVSCDIPRGWPRRPVYPDSGDVPGPPIQYEEITPDKVKGGYTFADAGNIGEVDQFFYHGDHLSSVVLVTDSKARIVQRLAYTPYGEILLEQSNTDSDLPYRFTGKPLDQETGLHYFGARYYDNVACVWLGVDPKWDENVGEGVYVYCSGNPIIFIDPDGRDGKGWRIFFRCVNIGASCLEMAAGFATIETGAGVFAVVDGFTRFSSNLIGLTMEIANHPKSNYAPTNLADGATLVVCKFSNQTEEDTDAARTVIGTVYDVFTFPAVQIKEGTDALPLLKYLSKDEAANAVGIIIDGSSVYDSIK